MLLKLAKKSTILRCCTYLCITLASLIAVLSTNTSALTQVAGNSQIPQKPIAIPIPTLSTNLISLHKDIFPKAFANINMKELILQPHREHQFSRRRLGK